MIIEEALAIVFLFRMATGYLFDFMLNEEVVWKTKR